MEQSVSNVNYYYVRTPASSGSNDYHCFHEYSQGTRPPETILEFTKTGNEILYNAFDVSGKVTYPKLNTAYGRDYFGAKPSIEATKILSKQYDGSNNPGELLNVTVPATLGNMGDTYGSISAKTLTDNIFYIIRDDV